MFCDILIVILAAAAVFSVTVGEFTEAVSILAIMLLNAVMGFVQEYRTERTLARLAELSAPRSLVRRGGRTVELPSSAVVPGDILLLCSDGLSNMVTDLEMLEYAKEYQDPELICRALMSKALIRGARDNVTVVAVMR